MADDSVSFTYITKLPYKLWAQKFGAPSHGVMMYPESQAEQSAHSAAPDSYPLQ